MNCEFLDEFICNITEPKKQTYEIEELGPRNFEINNKIYIRSEIKVFLS